MIKLIIFKIMHAISSCFYLPQTLVSYNRNEDCTMRTIQEDAQQIMKKALQDAQPDQAVISALKKMPEVAGKIVLVAIGKAAWTMADAVAKQLGESLSKGICITKYGHVKGDIPHVKCLEAGHPVPDQNSIFATKKAEKLVSDLLPDDLVIFCISGGGSALFEDPIIPLPELQDITSQLLACGADIQEINIIRKHLSGVKAGRFGQLCQPAHVYAIILSDIIGDPLDAIASGPAAVDPHTCQDAMAIVSKYHLTLSDDAIAALQEETPKALWNVETIVTGSVKQLCQSAEEECKRLGYTPIYLTSSLDCEAREAGRFLSAIARDHQNSPVSLAYVMGGETVVHLTGKGLGGRNQELALSACEGLSGCHDTCLFSIGSDGTDGPSDAAGGMVDEHTAQLLQEKGISIPAILSDNDSYHALQAAGALIKTGPTGTNVNDLTVLLIRRNQR